MTKTVLFISPVIPVPVNRGSALRTAMMMRTFVALGYDVHLALLNRSEPDTPPAEVKTRIEAAFDGVTAHVVTHPMFLGEAATPELRDEFQKQMKALKAERRARGHWHIQNKTEYPDYFDRELAKLRDAQRYDIIFVNYVKVLPDLSRDELGRTIVDLHDVQFNRVRNDEYPRWPRWTRKRRFRAFQSSELEMVQRPALRISITDVEREQLGPLLPSGAKIAVLPAIAPEQPERVLDQDRPFDFLFIGSNSDANGASIVWFLRECWPTIRAERPQARLLIQGAIQHNVELEALQKERDLSVEGVEIRGFAEDLSETYNAADIVISPTVRGTGMKVKVVEALSYGMPVIGTDVAFDGIGIVDGENGRRANTASGFAAACLETAQDATGRNTIAAGARALWLRDHSFEASKFYLEEAIRRLG